MTGSPAGPSGPLRRADVAVIGDGPAGSALAAACARRGVDVVLVGDDRAWMATYGAWPDELEGVEGLGDVGRFLARIDPVVAYGGRRHDLDRAYGVVDNGALRALLRSGVERIDGRVGSTRPGVTHHTVELESGGRIGARLVVLATGPQSGGDGGRRGPAWQTAFGAVLPDRPDGELGVATFMDFRDAVGGVDGGDLAVPTFLYALPVADGWLVEETVLAARPAVDVARLRDRLAMRLGLTVDELLARAVRTEVVGIPMGGPLPDRDAAFVRFGAAAGYVHPATGFSVTASLRAAPRVADAIAEATSADRDLAAEAGGVWEAVWPADLRRTRVLHDYGLARLAGLDRPAVGEFFDRFFDLPTADWASYLRIDASPGEVSRTMRRLFGSSGWTMRRRLAAGNPLALARLLRP